MNYVQPIRDPKKIEQVRQYLRSTSMRNYMLFLLCISTGLRIGDALRLRIRDVRTGIIKLKESKTRKTRRIPFRPELAREMKTYIAGQPGKMFLFRSRQGHNQPIGRSAAYKALRRAADHCGLVDIGTHSMRKTFGYHMYQQTKDVVLLQEIFGHSTPEITLRYIGVNQDKIDKAIKKLKF